MEKVEQEQWLTMSDGHEVFVKKWYAADQKPIAIVQLSHGMAEHINRYRQFVNALVDKGIFVFGNDHRGHGKTGEHSGLLGFFAQDNGFDRAVEDLREVNQFIRTQYPDTPVFLMGHSMGSFLVRRYIQCFQGKIAGVILSGTGGNPGFLGKVGKTLAKQQMKKNGPKTESPFMNKLTFGNYNKKFSNPVTEFDWLTKDRNVVQSYINDPHCGFIATAGFYYDLLTGLETIHKSNEINKIDKGLPFFFFSGDQDPVGNYTKGVLKVIQQYKNHGIQNIEYMFYQEGRHEMLNEPNNDEVTNDMIRWLEKQLC